MIRFEVSAQGAAICKFRVTGHAGYADHGEDIVCSAVSALVYNAVNSCERLAQANLDVKDDKNDFVCRVQQPYRTDDKVQLLLQSLVFGIEQIADAYPSFVRIVRRERTE